MMKLMNSAICISASGLTLWCVVIMMFIVVYLFSFLIHYVFKLLMISEFHVLYLLHFWFQCVRLCDIVVQYSL